MTTKEIINRLNEMLEAAIKRQQEVQRRMERVYLKYSL